MLRFLGVLVVLALIFGGIGVWRGWIDLSFSSDEDSGKKNLSIGLDKDKLDKDVDLVKDKLSKATSGVLESVDATTRKIKLKVGEVEEEISFDSDTKIELDGKEITPAELRPGDRIKIEWKEVEGKQLATGIVVSRD